MSVHVDPEDGERFSSTDAPAAIEGVEVAVFDGEVVLFDEASGMLHRLGAIAGAVWLCCDGATSVAAIGAELVEAFGLDPVEASRIVDRTLERLAEQGLLAGPHPVSVVAPPPTPESTLAEDGTEILIAPADP